MTEMEATPSFKPQRVNTKRGSTSRQTWEVDVGKDRISIQHQNVGGQVTNDPLEKRITMNTARSWWIDFDTMKDLENCLKNLVRRVCRKRRVGPRSNSRSEQTGIEKPIGTNVEEFFIGVLRKRDLSTLINPDSDGKCFYQDSGTNVVYVVLDWDGVGRSDFRRHVKVG